MEVACHLDRLGRFRLSPAAAALQRPDHGKSRSVEAISLPDNPVYPAQLSNRLAATPSGDDSHPLAHPEISLRQKFHEAGPFGELTLPEQRCG
jgi:hypothetical protein